MTARQHAGWSMIELLVTLVVAGLLAAACYPSYSQFVILGKRVEGQAALLLLMQQEERYFSANNSYIAFSSGSSEPAERQFQWWSGPSAASSAYEIEAKACDDERIASCVQLVAAPGTGMVDRHYKDEECGKLILTSAGQRLATGTSTRCWR